MALSGGGRLDRSTRSSIWLPLLNTVAVFCVHKFLQRFRLACSTMHVIVHGAPFRINCPFGTCGRMQELVLIQKLEIIGFWRIMWCVGLCSVLHVFYMCLDWECVLKHWTDNFFSSPDWQSGWSLGSAHLQMWYRHGLLKMQN